MQRATRRSVHLVSVVVVLATHLLVLGVTTVSALDRPILLREADGPNVAPGQQGCPLEANLTGDCANLRYYNLCSGYIWLYTLPDGVGEGAGVKFDGPCIAPNNGITRAITYWRNVAPGYGSIDVILDADTNGDGCPDYNLKTDNAIDPALRWNCTEYADQCIPTDAEAVILRAEKNSGAAPSWATDGPFSDSCDPVGTPHSYYYGYNGQDCVQWVGPTGRYDNFLWWLIVDADCRVTSTSQSTWGALKALYR